MTLPEICIKRPVLAIVLNLIIILLGLVCYDRLTVREYPNIDVPVINVETTYPGASAKVIETQITKPLEDSLSGIEGIDFIRSISRSESSQITVTFKLDRNADDAASDVRDRVGRVRGKLPDEIDEPIVSKQEADAQPIIWLSLNSTKHDALEVSEFARVVVKDRIQTLPGVSDVRLFAEREYAMRIWLSSDRMAAFGITTQDVEAALRSQNVEIPAGRIESSKREFTVLSRTDLNTPEQFNNIIIRNADNGHLVRVRDVARVEYGPKEDREIARFNNKSTIALGVIKQSVANPIEISDAINTALPEIAKILPDGMKIEKAYDSSVFIRESLQAVQKTILEAVAFVMVVIFFFLRSVRATLIPLVTIPISLIGALGMMYAFDFSINTLTLLALVIAIGLVVDDAIVVLENIYRHMEEGMDRIHAAVKGVREISFAVLAMTMTLAAVFAPIGFTPGRTGKLFVEFAFTLAGAVLVSGIVALTLTPMMCSRILSVQHKKKEARWSHAIDVFLHALDIHYERVLNRLSTKKILIAAIAAGVVALTAFLFSTAPSELSPREDRGIIFGIGIAPEGATIEYSDAYAKKMEAIMQSMPEAQWNFVAVGFPFVTQTFSVLGLSPWDERSRSSMEIAAELGGKMFGGIPGTLNFPITPPSLGQGARSQPVEVIIQATGTYEELDEMTNKIMEGLAENPRILAPDSDLKLNKPELRVDINRDKAASMGVNVETVGRTLESLLGSRQVTRFKRGNEQYDVMVQVEDDERTRPHDIDTIFVRSTSGKLIQLSNLVTLSEGVAPRELNHFDKLRAVTIKANLAPGYTTGQALDYVEKLVKKIAPDARLDYNGESREFKESSASLALTFLLAILFIYLVLAAQFESFIDPLIILLTVPLAMAGALLTMRLTGGTLNVYSQIGLIALVGLISKHGIMMVEFANQLQERGRSKQRAIIESASIRLRPILMTTAATVLGALPLAIASGAGAESRQAIGWVLVGGMSFGTLMTLFVVPTFYVLFSRVRRSIQIDENKLLNSETTD
ncbi:MAG: efflux RND transporter permease subunit [Alphaproteobacteria bacterium]|nr:efflux RND transporter permease subunit [Alphaproteobacteria bacterium]